MPIAAKVEKKVGATCFRKSSEIPMVEKIRLCGRVALALKLPAVSAVSVTSVRHETIVACKVDPRDKAWD